MPFGFTVFFLRAFTSLDQCVCDVLLTTRSRGDGTGGKKVKLFKFFFPQANVSGFSSASRVLHSVLMFRGELDMGK